MSSDTLDPPLMDTPQMGAGMDTPMDNSMDSPPNDQMEAPATAMPQSEMDAAHSERRQDGDRSQYKRSIYALPVTLQVVIGSARPTIAELLQMKDGTLLTLSSKIDDPVDLCINDRIIARGELVETDAATGGIGVRLTEIVDISEDILGA